MGGATATFSFTVERDFGEYDAALAAFLAAGDGIMAEAAVLRLTIDDSVTEWSNAVVGPVTPGLPFGEFATLSTEVEILIPAVPDEAGPD